MTENVTTTEPNNVCADCGTDKNVSYLADPYLEEMYDDIEMIYICEDCYYEKCQDI